MTDEKDEKPRVVRSHDITIDREYTQWIGEIKRRFRKAQIKAAVKVNSEQLLFNWCLGRDLVIKRAEEKWGKGVVEQVSLDLRTEFPETKGFSTSNLWYMKKWYMFYAGVIDELKLQQFVGETVKTNSLKLRRRFSLHFRGLQLRWELRHMTM